MSDDPSMIPHRSRGFTLIEILIAIFILGVVLTTVFAAYSGTLTVIRDLEDEAQIYKMARIAMDRMSRDICAAERSGKGFVFQSEKAPVGSREFASLFIWSGGHLAFEEGESSGQAASIAYNVKEDKDGGFSLWRSDVAGYAPSTQKESDGGIIICQNLRALNLKFYDENRKEYDAWDTASSLAEQKGKPPVFARIELILDNANNAEKPYRFSTKVYLPVRK